MYERLKNLFYSPVSILSMLMLLCCLITFNVLLGSHGEIGMAPSVAILAGFLILVAWLVWAVTILVKRSRVAEMPRRTRLVIDRISFLFSLLWLVSVIFPPSVRPWCLAIIWAAFAACVFAVLHNMRKGEALGE